MLHFFSLSSDGTFYQHFFGLRRGAVFLFPKSPQWVEQRAEESQHPRSTTLSPWARQNNVPHQDVPILNPETCEYVISHAKEILQM